MILTIRTDKPEAEIGLFDASGKELAYKKWEAHKLLSTTLFNELEKLVSGINENGSINDIDSIVFYKGPGSFTGLRIGASFVNALQVKLVNENGENWINQGIKRLSRGYSEVATPFYGAEARTTQQKK